MAFFNSAVGVLQTLVVALGAGLLASGDPDHILSGVTNHYLSGNWEPIDGVSDCQQPRLANGLFLRCHRLNSLYHTGL